MLYSILIPAENMIFLMPLLYEFSYFGTANQDHFIHAETDAFR